MKSTVIGLGAGGHAKVVIEILRLSDAYDLIGLLDSNLRLKGTHVLGVPVLGDDACLPGLIQAGLHHFFVGLGSTGNVAPRRRLYELACGYGLQPVTAIHPQAMISPSATLGRGATVMAGAVINAAARLGANVIINTGAIVEHDGTLGDHVHIATGARLASTVEIGAGTHIGAGATIKQCLTIGEDAIVGAGAVVIENVPSRAVAAGVPARVLRMRSDL